MKVAGRRRSRMKVLKWLDAHVEEAVLSTCLLILIVLTSANVVLRYVFNSGLTWSDEICKYCLIFSGFISISYWIRHKSGICVDALLQLVNEPVKKGIYILVQILVLIFFLLMFQGAVRCWFAIKKSGQVSGTLQIPMTYVYIAPVIGFGMALLREVQVVIQDLTAGKRGGYKK